MQKASILVVPSIWNEPFGLTALEGLANRQVVIASKVGGLIDIVGRRGILIQKIDQENVASKLRKLMKNKDELNKYQNNLGKYSMI